MPRLRASQGSVSSYNVITTIIILAYHTHKDTTAIFFPYPCRRAPISPNRLVDGLSVRDCVFVLLFPSYRLHRHVHATLLIDLHLSLAPLSTDTAGMSATLTLSRLLLLSFLVLLLLSAPSTSHAQKKPAARKSDKPTVRTPPLAAANGDVDEPTAVVDPPATPTRAAAPRARAAVAADDAEADTVPGLRGSRSQATTVKKAAGTKADAKPAKAADEKSKKKSSGKKAAEKKNGWLADMAEAENVAYLLNIGTAKYAPNVIADDHTQPSYQPHVTTKKSNKQTADDDVTTAEVGDVADFYIWRRQTDDEVAGGKTLRSITMQRPVVFVQDSDVLDAAVQNWGVRSIRLLPALTEEVEPISFSLVTSCKKAGTTYVNVALRAFETTAGARSRKNIEYSVKRTCTAPAVEESAATPAVEKPAQAEAAGEAETETPAAAPAVKKAAKAAAKKVVAPVDVHSAATHFDISLLEASGVELLKVVTEGQPVTPFRPQETKPGKKSSDEPVTLYAIPAHQSRIDLSIRYSGAAKRTLNKPVLYVTEANVMTVSENLGKVALMHGEERRFSLTFNCLAEGDSTFTVILTMKEDSRQQLKFAMIKQCTGPERTEGVAGLAIDVATVVGAHDVVDDGLTKKEYLSIGKWDQENWAHRADIVPIDYPSSIFYITTTHADGYSYEQPVVTAFSADGTVIAQPKVSGSVVTIDPLKLRPDETLELVLEYRCEVDGVAGVTVSLPITDHGSIQWTLRKQCEKPTVDEQMQQQADDVVEKAEHEALGLSIDENNQTIPIPGLNIGFSRNAHGQMYNGVVEDMYRLQLSTEQLAYCKSNRQFLTFYLYQNTSVPGAVDVAFGKPEVITTSDISQPILSGSLDGGVVNATHHASFTITFHCLVDGQTMYTLTIPLLPLAPAIKPPRSSITLSFLKGCNKSDNVLTAETGGVGIQGFRIGTTEGGNEVVHDGFPSIHYYGQKDRDDPNWNGIIVPEEEVSSTFYLTYVGGENIGEQALTFQPPMLVSHSSLVKPELSGSAAQGGQIKKNSAGLTLDLTYNCRVAGLVPITIVLLVNDGQIVFTVPKVCNGTLLPEGTLHKGLNVGVTEGGSEVVKDGLVAPNWASGQDVIIREDEEVTRFWISMTDGVLQAIEPFVRAHVSIAQPTIDHDMYVSVGAGGELLQETPDEEYDEGQDEAGGIMDAIQQALSSIKALRENGSEQVGSELAEDEMDDVYIDSRPAQLNVSYACFDQGSTPITFVMPLKMGYLEWQWIKRCPATQFWAGVASIVPTRGDGDENNNNPGVTWSRPEDQNVAGEGRIAGGDGNGWANNDVAAPPADDDEDRQASVLAQPDDGRAGEAQTDGADDADNYEADDFDIQHLSERRLPQEEVGGQHQNDPYEEHTDAESKDFARVDTLIVSSSLRLAQANRGDVFHLDDGLRSKYKRPTSVAGLSTLAIIPADVTETSFFVTTSKSSQGLRRPTVKVPKEVSARRVGIQPRVLLAPPMDEGGPQQRLELSRDDEPVEFIVQWHCNGLVGGITPAIVSIWLLPEEAGVLHFYVGKMCDSDVADASNSGSRTGRGWSLYLMLLVGVAASFGAMYYFGTKGGKEQLSSLVSNGLNNGLGKSGRSGDTLQRGEYQIVSQKAPRRREEDGI